MKYMLTFILFSLFISFSVEAQSKVDVYQGIVSIKQHIAELEKDSVVWDMDVYIQGLSVGKYQSLVLTPVIYSATDSLALAPIILNGKDKQKATTRKMILTNKVKEESAYTIIGYDAIKSLTVPYRCKFAYKGWMQNAGLRLLGQVCNFEGKPVQTFVDVLSKDLRLKAEPEVIRPDTIYVKLQR